MRSDAISEIRSAIGEIYKTVSLPQRILAKGRPSICPFHVLTEYVPPDSSVLDIGCGSGIFLNLLTYQKRISSGIGFDASLSAIETARKALAQIGDTTPIEFQYRSVKEGLPAGEFSLVSMIDVIHHIEPNEQRRAIESAIAKVSLNGLFLFKDIGMRPRWRAWANRLHDLVLARQWIHYVPLKNITTWAEKAGLKLVHMETINMLWYGHELLVFQKTEDSIDK